jgi:hypothetical protein
MQITGPHTASQLMTNESTMAVRLSTAYHPVLISYLSDFCFSGSLKQYLTGKRFTTDLDLKQAVTSSLQKSDTGFFYVGITDFLPRDRCFNVSGVHMQVCVYHQLPICHVYIEVKIQFSALGSYVT